MERVSTVLDLAADQGGQRIGAYKVIDASCEEFHDDPELVAFDKASVIPCYVR
jgi:hypothetical protein